MKIKVFILRLIASKKFNYFLVGILLLVLFICIYIKGEKITIRELFIAFTASALYDILKDLKLALEKEIENKFNEEMIR